MTKYMVSVIIGILVLIVLGISIIPILSVIIGGFIAGILCKGCASRVDLLPDGDIDGANKFSETLFCILIKKWSIT